MNRVRLVDRIAARCAHLDPFETPSCAVRDRLGQADSLRRSSDVPTGADAPGCALPIGPLDRRDVGFPAVAAGGKAASSPRPSRPRSPRGGHSSTRSPNGSPDLGSGRPSARPGLPGKKRLASPSRTIPFFADEGPKRVRLNLGPVQIPHQNLGHRRGVVSPPSQPWRAGRVVMRGALWALLLGRAQAAPPQHDPNCPHDLGERRTPAEQRRAHGLGEGPSALPTAPPPVSPRRPVPRAARPSTPGTPDLAGHPIPPPCALRRACHSDLARCEPLPKTC
jgi:hypothetical protein